jgi:hypothetical protein
MVKLSLTGKCCNAQQFFGGALILPHIILLIRQSSPESRGLFLLEAIEQTILANLNSVTPTRRIFEEREFILSSRQLKQ